MNGRPGFVNGIEVPLAKRQSRRAAWLAHAAAGVGLGLLLGFLGPFRSGTSLEPAVRYPFWLALTLFGYACALAALQLAGSFPMLGRLKGPLLVAVAALLSAIPQTFATAWALSFVQHGRSFAPLQLPALFAAVLTVQLGIALAAWAVAQRGSTASGTSEAPPHPPAFLDRVPTRLGRDLVALEAEDHYLRVYTALGSELILARLSDAVAQLDGYDGLRVHRSWWVATDAVTGTVSRNGRTALQLKNGLVAPVSRTYLPAVRQRGWPPA